MAADFVKRFISKKNKRFKLMNVFANENNRTYPAKLLLFGEYTVLGNSQALAFPIPIFTGKWSHLGIQQDLLDLEGLISFLRSNKSFSEERIAYFQRAYIDGLRFVSNIPIGYGLGSSGALSAAIYERYLNESTEKNILQSRKDLAGIEAFFHGSSSGLDPLVSFLNQPVLKSGMQYQAVKLPKMDTGGPRIFLIDSGSDRKSRALIREYRKMLLNDKFQTGCLNHLVPLVNQTIHEFLLGLWSIFRQNLLVISRLQWEWFQPMIPNTLHRIWKNSLTGEPHSIKLCGAGGGGYFLGFSWNWDRTEKILQYENVQYVKLDLLNE
jgi:mevalonate kinase